MAHDHSLFGFVASFGRELEYPEMLIEGQLKDLKRRNRIFGGNKEVRPGDKDVETFRQGEPGLLGLFED